MQSPNSIETNCKQNMPHAGLLSMAITSWTCHDATIDNSVLPDAGEVTQGVSGMKYSILSEKVQLALD